MRTSSWRMRDEVWLPEFACSVPDRSEEKRKREGLDSEEEDEDESDDDDG